MKKIVAATIGVCVLALAGVVGLSIYKANANRTTFDGPGYLLMGESGEAKHIPVDGETAYVTKGDSRLSFTDTEGNSRTAAMESFINYSNGSVQSLTDGVLVDFNDLSDNFINNYTIKAKVPVYQNGGTYEIAAGTGSVNVGEHLWKLDDNKYIIEAPELNVVFGPDDVRTVKNYVQVNVTEDGIVQMLTEENFWMTISADVHIDTPGGVSVYPVTQIIEDAQYKMSIPSLSVNADDNIVLTPDEMRRQIVPQFVIDAQDGKDGADGENGNSGEAGLEGSAGEAGVSGSEGSMGINGTAGVDGEEGVSGTDGKNGKRAASGLDAKGGKDGSSGVNGKNGDSAVIASTTNTAVPTMSVNIWNVGTTTLMGSFLVKDESGFFDEELYEMDPDKGDYKYPARVKIIDEQTKEEINCYVTNETFIQPGSEDDLIDFGKDLYADGAEELYFTTYGEPLRPDTSYRLMMNAYYVDTTTHTIFQRQFISRLFYTDSTGVILAEEKTYVNRADILVSLTGDYKQDVSTATVLLLTEEQNEGFVYTDNAPYQYKYVLDYNSGMITPYNREGEAQTPIPGLTRDGYRQLPMPDLSSNTNYVGRVYVTTSALSTLTTQELHVKTLKKTPAKMQADANVLASYNRVSGAFEVYRPAINDPDNGIENYIYGAYVKGTPTADTKKYFTDSAGVTWIMEKERSMEPGEAEPVMFYLNRDTQYRFRVEGHFNDNKTETDVDFGYSESLISEGGNLPDLVLAGDVTNYDHYSGKLTINWANKGSFVTVDASHPLQIDMYADQIFDKSVTFDSYDQAREDSSGSDYTYRLRLEALETQSNKAEVDIELNNLYRNTRYTMTVSAYVDIDSNPDVDNYTKRTLGTVSFFTLYTGTATFAWNPLSTDKTGTKVRCAINDSTLTKAEREYQVGKIVDTGSVVIKLYSGNLRQNTDMATTTLSGYALEQMFGLNGNTGYELTLHDFNDPELSSGAEYFVMVDNVFDGTHDMNLKYENTFATENVSQSIKVLTALPPLSKTPNTEVFVNPITNKDASRYGARYNEALPDDTIIGYTLESLFVNSEHAADSVTYYAMEYSEFFSTIKNVQTDPIRGSSGKDPAHKLMVMTQPADKTKNTVPKVAILFNDGTNKTSAGRDPVPSTDATAEKYNDYFVYWSGTTMDGSGSNGLSRGHRYIFAYTVDYTVTTTTGTTSGTYPYDYEKDDSGYSATFESYKNEYGCGRENQTLFGAGTAYVLNSGMVSAPMVEPKFSSYLYNVEFSNAPNSDFETTSGMADIHYSWRDLDHVIVKEQEPGKTTMIKTVTSSGAALEGAIDGNPVMDGSTAVENWYYVQSYFTSTSAEPAVVSPEIEMSLYKIDYTEILTYFNYTEEIEEFFLCHVPIDWNFGGYFAKYGKGTASAVKIDFDPEMYPGLNPQDQDYADKKYAAIDNYVKTNNKYKFRISDGIAPTLSKRIYAVKLSLTAYSEEYVSAPIAGRVPQVIYSAVDVDATENFATFEITTGEIKYGEYTEKELDPATGHYVDVTKHSFEKGDYFGVEAELYYDNGLEGISLMDEDAEHYTNPVKMYAFQRSIDTNGEAALLTYFSIYGGGSGEYPSGAVVSNANENGAHSPGVTNFQFTRRMRDQYKKNEKLFVNEKYLAYAGPTFYYYLYPDSNGISYGNSSYVDTSYKKNDSRNYLVVKGSSEYELTSLISRRHQLNYLTPVVSPDGEGVAPSARSAALSSFSVLNFAEGKPDAEGKHHVKVSLYTDYESASRLDTDPEKRLQTLDVTLDESGRYTRAHTAEDLAFTNLTPSTRYYFVYSMELYDGTGWHDTVLISSKTAKEAVLNFTTSGDVKITPTATGAYYLNSGYNSKTVNMAYNVSRFVNITMRYDIFARDDCAEVVEVGEGDEKEKKLKVNAYDENDIQVAVLSHEEIEANGLIVTDTFPAYDNNLSISLKPGALSSRLTPGVTYYLRLVCYENAATTRKTITDYDGNQKQVDVLDGAYSGVVAKEFMIPVITNYESYFYVKKAEWNYIDFEVTPVDDNYCFIADPGKVTVEGKEYSNIAWYAVRFAYEDPTVDPSASDAEKQVWLQTVYDDRRYLTTTSKSFVISPETVNDETFKNNYFSPAILDAEKGNVKIYMYVYALVDSDYDGLAGPVPVKSIGGGTGYKIDPESSTKVALGASFFYEGANGEALPTNYKDLINAFWSKETTGAKMKRNPAMKEVEEQFLVGSKLQRTTDKSGLSINHDKASIRRDPYNTLAFQFILQESFGLLVENEDVIKTVMVQITGPVDNGGFFNQQIVTSSVEGAGGYKNFVNGMLKSSPVFIHSITYPGGISHGNYTAVIKLYKEARSEITDMTVPYDSWTFQTY